MLTETLLPYFAAMAAVNQSTQPAANTPGRNIKKGDISPHQVKYLHYGVMLQLGQKLFDQQCWCWGRDIVSPRGNLLCQYGFSRLKPPPEQHGSSLYIWHDYADDGALRRLVALWGFGFYYATPQQGALFLRRFEFQPRWVFNPLPTIPLQISPIWRPDQLTLYAAQPNDGLATLFGQALGWLADYEAWVMQARGLVYRHISLSKWLHKPVVPVRHIAGIWRMLGMRVANPPNQISHSGLNGLA